MYKQYSRLQQAGGFAEKEWLKNIKKSFLKN